MTPPRNELRLLTARLDAAFLNALARLGRRYREAAEALDYAAGRTRRADRSIAPAPTPGTYTERLSVGDVKLIPPNRVVRGDHVVHLSPTEFAIFKLLATDPGRVLTHDRILGEISGHRMTRTTLGVLVKRLRDKLDAGGQPRPIHNVPGVGYALRAPNTFIDPAQPGAVTSADLVLNPLTRTATRGNRPLTLTRPHFDILEQFMRHPGRVLSPGQLAETATVPGRSPTTLKEVYNYIHWLRKELEVDGEPRLIHNVRALGYVLRNP